MYKSDFKLTAPELRALSSENIERAKNLKKNNIHIVLDNVVDAYNVGSAFRIADSINASTVWICGSDIVHPTDKQVQKSSMNTSQFVNWKLVSDTKQIFREKGLFIALEKLQEDSEFRIKLTDCKNINNICEELNTPIFVIVGSERFGISKEVLAQVNTIVELPMFGVNTSMNVINALTVLCYSLVGAT